MFGRGKKKINQEQILNKLLILSTAALGVTFGIVFMLISNLEFIKDIESLDVLLNTLGQVLITVSIGSLLMEWFGYVNYTRKRMCEILAEDEVIKVLDLQRKKELKSALIKNIYMYNAPKLQNEEHNISTIIDEEMDNILCDYYFEEYIIYIDVSIDEINGKKYIKKKMRHTFTAKTINNQETILLSPISTYLKPPKEDAVEAFKLEKFIINGEYQDVKNWQIKTEDNIKKMPKTYTKRYSLDNIIDDNKNLFSFSEKIDVDFEFTTNVDIDDLVYTYHVRKACKHFCIHYNAPKEYKILMDGFGFMSTGNSQRQRVIETETGCMLRFLDWILPGNGVMIVLQNL